jgi:tetratricopeptide (TPR) repeat protein
VATHVESRIHITEVEQTLKLSTECLDAWSAYHRGLWHMYRFNRDDNAIAERMFQLAANKDPFFARAYAGLSFTCFQAAFLRYSDDVAQRRDLARKHAEKSFELDPYDPFANLTMGRSAWLDDHLDDAAVWFDRSLDLSPNYAFAQYNRGFIDALLNNGTAGEQRAIKALTLSPIDPLRYAFLGTRALSCLVRGNYAEAATWAEKAIREPTAHVHIFGIAAMCHELAGNHDLAIKHAARILEIDPGYLQQGFFRSFQFRDSKTIATVKTAFSRLGMS